jgi:RNA 3'-terminal phosphate cyclase (ATP)
VEGTIAPSLLGPLSLVDRGALVEVIGLSAVAGVAGRVAERQRDQALARLKSLGVPCRIDCASVEASNPGTVLFLLVRTEGSQAGFSSLGERGKPAERVADEACDALSDYVRRPGAADPHLADQLLMPMVLARGSSAVTTTRVTEHLRTNQWVVERFLPGRVHVEGAVGEPGRVTVQGGVDGER